LGPNRDKFGTGMFLLNFMARYGWFLSGGFVSVPPFRTYHNVHRTLNYIDIIICSFLTFSTWFSLSKSLFI